MHGGPEYARPIARRAEGVVEALEKYVPLAPLHQPHNLAPIRLLLARDPDAAAGRVLRHGVPPQRSPTVAQAFALPRRITERGVLRYGFHGLSYEYIAQALPRIDARAAAGKTVVLHLGNGAIDVRDGTAGAAWRARWASPRRTACRWARAAATSIRA